MDYNELKNQLIIDEGLRRKPYLDTAKPPKRTIGIGHNMDANPLPKFMADYLKETGKLTDEMILDLFMQDIATAVLDCGILWPKFGSFSDGRQRALVNFMFNVGLGTAREFTNTTKAINREDWEAAAKGFEHSLWYSQVGDRAKRIVALIRGG